MKTTIFALTNTPNLKTLTDIEMDAIAAVEQEGFKVKDSYATYAVPEVISDLPSDILWDAIMDGVSIAIVFLSYKATTSSGKK